MTAQGNNGDRNGGNERIASGDVVGRALEWLADGRKAAIAVVVKTWGSSPRPAGSLLCVNDGTAFLGSVSGGCVEGDVVTRSLELMKSGGFDSVDYGIADEDAWRVGLACGGKLEVFMAAITEPWLDALSGLADAGREKRPAALVIDLGQGTPELHAAGSGGEISSEIADALRTDRSGIVEDTEGRRLFVGAFNPPLRMLVVGAVHIAQALVPIARASGFDVTVIDPRGAWATPERFPGVVIDERWPDEAMQALGPDRRTAVVSLSHDPKLDDPALLQALKSDAFYIGALGSKRTHAKRLDRLAAEGADAASLERIRGPVGLDIGAETPGEIALAVVGQAVETLRKGAE